MTQTDSLTPLDAVLPDDLPTELGEFMRAAGLGAGGLYWKLGITIESATPQRVSGTMPVEGNTQPQLLLHGGASIAFAETLASTAAALFAGDRRVAVGIEVSASHHRSARDGLVHGVATAVHLGSSLATYDVSVADDRNRLLCSARVTCAIRPRPEEGR
jgi:1,4-dihydroxy-2-naphthoyl-CoA hydrolase